MAIDGDAVRQVSPDASLRPVSGPGGDNFPAIAARWSDSITVSLGLVFLVGSFEEPLIDLLLVETTISSADPAVDQFGQDLEVADFDGDGIEDLATSNISDPVLPGGRGKSVILVYSRPFSGPVRSGTARHC